MENIMHKKVGSLDKTYKPLILKWLCKLFGYENYPHSFKDQWINWHIWDGLLVVGFDLRQEEHKKLLSLIHPRFIGIPQYQTLKIVNEHNFYLELNQLLNIEYPNIVGHELISKNLEKGGSGGWTSESDNFYTYDWNVFLEGGDSLLYHNQKPKMDLLKGDFIYNKMIQEREFLLFITNYK